jgi:hypothetical protein
MSYKIIGQGEKWTVVQGDVLDYLAGSLWQRQYEQSFFHFCFDDWPYNLESQTKRFGNPNSAPAKFGRDGAFARQSAGFMGARWDTDLAYRPETWAALLPHLHPGAFTASFSHPRKQDLLAFAQRCAGYVMNPALYQLGWVYSSGKPNGTNMGLLLDKRAGANRTDRINGGHMGKVNSGGDYRNGKAEAFDKIVPHVKGKGDISNGTPLSPLARTWAGHQYGSPLAPELEPILIAQAPWHGLDRLDTITATGAGAVNIEAGKNGMPGRGHPGHLMITHHPGCEYRGVKMIKNNSGDVVDPPGQAMGKNGIYNKMEKHTPYRAKGDASGMIAVPDYLCHPDCPVARLDAQTGDEKSYHFYQADWTHEITERLAETNPVFYTGKVQVAERNAGLSGMPLSERHRVNPGGLEREPRFATTWQENNHPTLKPIKLCKHISGLFLPPAEYAPRRMIDCTSGTGSLPIGALLAGWDEVLAVEIDPKFASIACRRLEWWSDWLRFGQSDPKAILAAEEIHAAQTFMFAGGT